MDTRDTFETWYFHCTDNNSNNYNNKNIINVVNPKQQQQQQQQQMMKKEDFFASLQQNCQWHHMIQSDGNTPIGIISRQKLASFANNVHGYFEK